MKGEYGLSRSQLKGYLFEIIIFELLKKNNFTKVNTEPGRVREKREGFIEFKGRGCWHQIDCPCDYCQCIPFSYQLRLLGEVKFYKTPLEKKHIREYIGVIKDIQENYFVADGVNLHDFYPRKMEIGVYFSANGFQAEAEKLAYAHGIKTISYANNYLINRIKNLIEILEENYLSVSCMRDNQWNDFRREFIERICQGPLYFNRNHYPYWNNDYMRVLGDIHQLLIEIQSSFIATTATGVFLHFVSDSRFPEELFITTDEGQCRVYFDYDDFGNRYFWMEIRDDVRRRRFYFTPPESLDTASVFGSEEVLSEKERHFRKLNVNIELNEISRNLILRMDIDWLNDVRNNINF